MLGFRVWDEDSKKFITDLVFAINSNGELWCSDGDYEDCGTHEASDNFIPMQSTGIKDSDGLTEVYEGDIIDSNGIVIGNIYENEPRNTDLIIQGFAKKAWDATVKEAMERGCFYPE